MGEYLGCGGEGGGGGGGGGRNLVNNWEIKVYLISLKIQYGKFNGSFYSKHPLWTQYSGSAPKCP